MLAQIDVDFREQIISDYLGVSECKVCDKPEYLAPIREVAFNFFQKNGFPSIKNEDWKYTPVKPYLNEPLDVDQDDISHVDTATAPYFGKQLPGYKIVLINGLFHPELSDMPDQSTVTIEPVINVLREPEVKNILLKSRNYRANPFLAMNTALFTRGIYINVPRNVKIEKPIHLIHFVGGKQKKFNISKNIIIINPGAEAEIIESYYHAGHDSVSFRNSATEILIEPNAVLHHIKLQKAHENFRLVEHTEVEQKQDSVYNNYTFTLPGMNFVRNNLNLELNGSNIESHMYGLYLTDRNQLVDNHTLVNHKEPNCNSNQLYKGILTDRSRAVFNGKVYVHSIAQKTNAFQQNNNILFSDNATIYTKPQLEIFADDVKCSHGSTIGQLDDEALFYLRARGLSKDDAQSLLVNAFAFDVTEKLVDDEIKIMLNDEIDQVMTGVIS
ncbi:MAG TPA: Fe-S cluster assembly protein SufD [Membranihabitans sp.]|nr:Fe-S cluster assembly protein SufD [Membranihabitans sp.]